MALQYWYVYECPPIDWWQGWLKIPIDIEGRPYLPTALVEWLTYEDSVLDWGIQSGIDTIYKNQLFESAGYDGEPRGKYWHMAPVPNPKDCDTAYIFSVKADNNGTTYVASPFEMPHMEWEWVKIRFPRE